MAKKYTAKEVRNSLEVLNDKDLVEICFEQYINAYGDKSGITLEMMATLGRKFLIDNFIKTARRMGGI